MRFTVFERMHERAGSVRGASCLESHGQGGRQPRGPEARADSRRRHTGAEHVLWVPGLQKQARHWPRSGSSESHGGGDGRGCKAAWVPHGWCLGTWGAQKWGACPGRGGVRTGAAHEALGAGRSRRGGRGEDGRPGHGELRMGTGLSAEDAMHWLPVTSPTSSFLSGFTFLVCFDVSWCVSSVPANRMRVPREEGSDGLIQCHIPRPENSRCPVGFWGQPEDCRMGAFPSSRDPRGCPEKAGVAQESQARLQQACARAWVRRQERAAS